ncbi:stealth family protein [Wenjunlia vitaminophila]|uniref:stealth family protein n=1 Tax=Wenjunlia vitaminophila TaxID=76728 RepID=UPI0003A17916|nr:stealth family protein [Wenjunlia vitaminophila]
MPSAQRARHAVLHVRGWAAGRMWELRAGRRRRRLARDPAVRRVTIGHLRLSGRLVDGYTAADAAADDLELVTDLLQAADVPYFLVPRGPEPRHVIGIEERYRSTLLAAARRHLADTVCYVGAANPDGTVGPAALWADRRLPKAVRRARVIRMGTIKLGPIGQAMGGVQSGCEIEFWQRVHTVPSSDVKVFPWLTVPGAQLGESFVDSLVAPRRNQVAEVVPLPAQQPATVRVRQRDVPTLAPFAQPGIDEVRFPIDAVYTWVDGDDPAMAAKRAAYRGDADIDIASREVGASRYTSHDELKYSLRSLEMYAGFVRHVYLVTDGQMPHWLDPEAEGITVVDHRDIFPEEALPVFNSHAIETRLHHIPGLSDHYLYFNDDVFINHFAHPGQFFHGNGIARIPFSPMKFGVGAPHPLEPAPNSAGKNVRELLLRSHGVNITNKFLHTPHPQLKSVMEEIEAAGFPEFRATSFSRFRSTKDVSPTSALHHHWALASGQAVPADYRYLYVEVGKPDMRKRLDRITNDSDIDFFCVNDVDADHAAWESANAALRAFLNRKYPFPSRFERKPDQSAESPAVPSPVVGRPATGTGSDGGSARDTAPGTSTSGSAGHPAPLA